MIENGKIRLADDRLITWAEYGPKDGTTLLLFHGGNDSRLVGRLLEPAAEEHGVRLVCPDRPGFGGSTFLPGRRLIDWPADVRDLADHLGLDEFAVLGHSGGGPHALACASALSHRVRAASTVSSVAPNDARNHGMHPMFRFVNFLMGSPRIYRRVARSQVRQMLDSPERWLTVWGRMQPADGVFFAANPDAAHNIVLEMTEAVRNGLNGVVHEAGLYHRDWDIDLGTIVTPTHVWHGRRDRQAAHTWAEYLAAQIPGATLTSIDSGGHFSTLIDHADDIVDWVTRHP